MRQLSTKPEAIRKRRQREIERRFGKGTMRVDVRLELSVLERLKRKNPHLAWGNEHEIAMSLSELLHKKIATMTAADAEAIRQRLQFRREKEADGR